MEKLENVLSILHDHFTKMPHTIRETVCKECNWSTPTFYRKLRYQALDQSDARRPAVLSNAEKDCILRVTKEAMDKTYTIISALR